MANIKSAIKRIRIAEENRARNRAVKSSVKTAVRRFQEAAASNDEALTKQALVNAVSQLDRAAAKGVIHKNAAARRKSALMRAANAK
ncbi:MAG: 30S ribosomal protein S20 [Chloroflexota bacterium]